MTNPGVWHHYRCHNLLIASELALPELVSAPADGEPDVRVRIAPLPEAAPEGVRRLHAGLWAGARLLRLHVPEVGRYEVREGREIIIDPAPDSDHLSLRAFLQGSAFGAVLIQRGHLVLHGNAIRIGDACMVCVGHSGAGKSTLAAAMMRRGHEVLSDDVVAITPDGRALPGFPRIKLWQDAADHLGIATGELARVLPSMDKYNLPLVRDQFVGETLPVRWIHVLEWQPGTALDLQRLHGQACFQMLREHTYRHRYLVEPAQHLRHLQQCADLMRQARLTRVRRPDDKSLSPDDTAALLLADMARED